MFTVHLQPNLFLTIRNPHCIGNNRSLCFFKDPIGLYYSKYRTYFSRFASTGIRSSVPLRRKQTYYNWSLSLLELEVDIQLLTWGLSCIWHHLALTKLPCTVLEIGSYLTSFSDSNKGGICCTSGLSRPWSQCKTPLWPSQIKIN